MARTPATPTLQIQWPKPGPVTIAVLVMLGGMSVLQAALVNLLGDKRLFELLMGDSGRIRAGQVWRLLSPALLTNPQGIGHIAFSLLLFYFFMPDLEKRWKATRLVLFLLYACVFGHAFTVLIDTIAFDHPLFHTRAFFGPGALDSAISVAWSLTNPNAQIRLFFFIPVRGAWLKWVTLGFALVGGLLYASGVPEGPFTLVGAWGIGMLLGGTPSVLRSVYLRMRAGKVERDLRAARKSGPSLKVVYGGLSDELGLDKDKKKPNDRTIH